jgi:hypothetical protein
LKLRTSEKIAIAELRLRSNIALKSCGIAIAEVFPSSCGIAIADSKKKLRVPTSGRNTGHFFQNQTVFPVKFSLSNT